MLAVQARLDRKAPDGTDAQKVDVSANESGKWPAYLSPSGLANQLQLTPLFKEKALEPDNPLVGESAVQRVMWVFCFMCLVYDSGRPKEQRTRRESCAADGGAQCADKRAHRGRGMVQDSATIPSQHVPHSAGTLHNSDTGTVSHPLFFRVPCMTLCRLASRSDTALTGWLR